MTASMVPGRLRHNGRVAQQAAADAENAAFWNELCGSSTARSLGITDASPESLRIFDCAYFDLYPYLYEYVPADFGGAKVLDIGLGYGTFGQLLAERGALYYGVDVAPNAVAMTRERLRRLGTDAADRIRVASALALPFDDDTFDYVYAMGSLHHTGELRRAVREAVRVLRPGGTLVLMVYNRYSYRLQIQVPVIRLKRRLRGLPPLTNADVRAWYDGSASSGEGAPHTAFSRPADVRSWLRDLDDVRIRRRNFGKISWPRLHVRIPRERLLWAGRFLGLDLYVTARKPVRL
jgi:SAM-dependent methyltransferase